VSVVDNLGEGERKRRKLDLGGRRDGQQGGFRQIISVEESNLMRASIREGTRDYLTICRDNLIVNKKKTLRWDEEEEMLSRTVIKILENALKAQGKSLDAS